MISVTRQKEIAEAILAAIEKEGLLKKEAAWHLGIHTNYITWLGNEKYWPSIGDKWHRFEEFLKQHCKLTEFLLPDGEEHFGTRPEHKEIERGTALDMLTSSEKEIIAEREVRVRGIIETVSAQKKVKRKYTRRENPVRKVFDKQEQQLVAEREKNSLLMKHLNEVHEKLAILEARIEDRTDKFTESFESIKQFLKEPGLTSTPETRPQLVIFQRNIIKR